MTVSIPRRAPSTSKKLVGALSALGHGITPDLAAWRARLAEALEPRTFPGWLHPRVESGSAPIIVTMGDLGQQTAKVMGEIVESERAAVVTRHGRSIAVVIPIEPGSVERAAFEDQPTVTDLIDAHLQTTDVEVSESGEAADVDEFIREAGGFPS